MDDLMVIVLCLTEDGNQLMICDPATDQVLAYPAFQPAVEAAQREANKRREPVTLVRLGRNPTGVQGGVVEPE